ncbi:MAG: acyltransferase family protein [Paludibacteraceae bacterium]|nr:acyltransferase family protein [Paludibacteraceae bacterium]
MLLHPFVELGKLRLIFVGNFTGGYKWIALFSRAFRLEAFVFVSGYVFAMQIIQKNKFTSVIELAKSKFIRLIIPCWIFGLVYWLMFRTTSPIVILKGIGHLWYLPCLFWCFLFAFFLYKKKWNEKFVVLSLLIISAISFLPLPMQLNRTMYYLLFFYLGGCAWKYSNVLVAKANFKTISVLFLLFVILLVGVNLFKEYSIGLISSHGIIFKEQY